MMSTGSLAHAHPLFSPSQRLCVTHSGSPDAGMKMFMQHNNFPPNCIECSPAPEIHKPPSSSLITHHSCTFLNLKCFYDVKIPSPIPV